MVVTLFVYLLQASCVEGSTKGDAGEMVLMVVGLVRVLMALNGFGKRICGCKPLGRGRSRYVLRSILGALRLFGTSKVNMPHSGWSILN